MGRPNTSETKNQLVSTALAHCRRALYMMRLRQNTLPATKAWRGQSHERRTASDLFSACYTACVDVAVEIVSHKAYLNEPSCSSQFYPRQIYCDLTKLSLNGCKSVWGSDLSSFKFAIIRTMTVRGHLCFHVGLCTKYRTVHCRENT